MTRRKFSYFPQHINGQIAIVVVSSIVLSVALMIAMIIMTRPEGEVESPTRADLDVFFGVVRLANTTQDAGARSTILETAAAAFPDWQIKSIPAGQTHEEENSKGPYIFFLRQHLGPNYNVALVPDEAAITNRFVFDITSKNGVAIRATLPAVSPTAPSLTPIVSGTLVFVAVSVAFLLLWATRALTSPLSRFADAAEQFGRDFEHQALPEQGPQEIRKASRAFNQMGDRIKRLMEDRTNMLAAISHDFRTPITRLRLRAEFLEDEAFRSAMLKDLEQLNDMVRSALAFLRDSRMEGSPTQFDLPSLLQTISDEFTEMGEEVSYLGVEHWLVTARFDGIRRAVTNLVDNALKFGTKAIIELQILSDGKIVIDVLDDGPGILDTDSEKLFRPFVRGDNARTLGPQSGFGLGLTIAKAIIDAEGGQLTLCNRQPSGLTARLTLDRPRVAGQTPPLEQLAGRPF